jgi:hypothetical protein
VIPFSASPSKYTHSSGWGKRRMRLIPRLHLHVQHRPDIRYEVTVISVRRASRLGRAISQLRVLRAPPTLLDASLHNW